MVAAGLNEGEHLMADQAGVPARDGCPLAPLGDLPDAATTGPGVVRAFSHPWRRASRLRRIGLSALSAGMLLGASIAGPIAPGAALADETTESRPSAVPEPEGYRMDGYRSPVPATLAGGTVVDTPEAIRLHEQGAPFIDVLPRVPRPKGLPEGTIWRPEQRHDIPGSIWLVDTGYGELAPVMERYFLAGLAEASQGDKAAPMVFYCKRDCWMSYNAAKRAIAAGYSSVYWYPDGTDGWAEAGRPLEKREPQPRPDE